MTPKPQACIRRSGADAYCRRTIETREFAFMDPHYAVKFYDARSEPRTPLVACANCCDVVRAMEKRERAA